MRLINKQTGVAVSVNEKQAAILAACGLFDYVAPVATRRVAESQKSKPAPKAKPAKQNPFPGWVLTRESLLDEGMKDLRAYASYLGIDHAEIKNKAALVKAIVAKVGE